MIIGICGAIGAGKDEVARVISEIYGFENKKFSGILKEVAGKITGKEPIVFEDREFKLTPMGETWGNMTGRAMLELIGEKMREVHPDTWVNALMSSYEPSKKWCISDVRYPNEVDAITKVGGIIVRVIRPENPHPQSNHHSNTSLHGYKFLSIINAGTLPQLRIQVEEFIEALPNRIRPSRVGFDQHLPDSTR